MKAIILFVSITVSFFLCSQVAELTEPAVEYEITEPETTEEAIPDETIPEGTEEVGFLFLSPEIDIFIMLKGDGWYYEDYDGIIVFFNYYSSYENTSIAFSSIPDPVDVIYRDDAAKYYIDIDREGFGGMLTDMYIGNLEHFTFGEYTAYKFYISGVFTYDNRNIAGEYVYWWTEDRQYTCSLFCAAEDYEYYSELLHESMESFIPVSQME